MSEVTRVMIVGKLTRPSEGIVTVLRFTNIISGNIENNE